MNLLKLRCRDKEVEVYHDENILCSFGDYDLNIYDDCNINYHSNSELGDAYEKPSANDKYALAGSEYFKVLEIEVYKVL